MSKSVKHRKYVHVHGDIKAANRPIVIIILEGMSTRVCESKTLSRHIVGSGSNVAVSAETGCT